MQRDSFGTLVHLEGEVTDRPFQAQFEDTISKKLSDGRVERRVVTGIIYRDSSGRKRRETHLEVGGGISVRTAYIFDPVAKVSYILDMIKKSVIKKTLLTPGGGQSTEEEESALKEPELKANLEVQDKSMPMRVIEGLNCYGFRHELPGEGTVEFWFSPELKELLIEKRLNVGKEKVFRVFNIRHLEPESTLFAVPPDYKAVGSGN